MYWISNPPSMYYQHSAVCLFNNSCSWQIGATAHTYCTSTLHSISYKTSAKRTEVGNRAYVLHWDPTLNLLRTYCSVIALNCCPSATTVVRGLQVGATAHMYCTLLPARQHPSISCRSLQQAQPRAPGALPRSFPRAPGWECRVFCSTCRIYIIVF